VQTYSSKKNKNLKKSQHVPLFKRRHIRIRKRYKTCLNTRLMLHKSKKIIYKRGIIINYKITQHLQLPQDRHIKNRYTLKKQLFIDVKQASLFSYLNFCHSTDRHFFPFEKYQYIDT